jgi:hypothetical protein
MPAKQTLKKPNLKEIGIPEEAYGDVYSDSFPVARNE